MSTVRRFRCAFAEIRQNALFTEPPPCPVTYPPFLWIMLYVVSVAADGHTICCVGWGIPWAGDFPLPRFYFHKVCINRYGVVSEKPPKFCGLTSYDYDNVRPSIMASRSGSFPSLNGQKLTIPAFPPYPMSSHCHIV